MRWIGWIVTLLMTVGWAAAEMPVDERPRAGLANTDWRRTCDGWERPTWFDASIPTHQPTLHPGVVGMLQLLVSLLALVAFPAFRSSRGRRAASPSFFRSRMRKGKPVSVPSTSLSTRCGTGVTPVAA